MICNEHHWEELPLFNFRNFFCTAVTAASMAAVSVLPAQAQELKIRMSVESTPGASTQQMLAAFRDALKEEMGDRLRSNISTAVRWATRLSTCSRSGLASLM